MEIVLNESRGSIFVIFGGLGGCFSDFLGLANRFENRGIFFGNVTDSEPGIC